MHFTTGWVDVEESTAALPGSGIRPRAVVTPRLRKPSGPRLRARGRRELDHELGRAHPDDHAHYNGSVSSYNGFRYRSGCDPLLDGQSDL